jgi:hypothetical protein
MTYDYCYLIFGSIIIIVYIRMLSNGIQDGGGRVYLAGIVAGSVAAPTPAKVPVGIHSVALLSKQVSCTRLFTFYKYMSPYILAILQR